MRDSVIVPVEPGDTSGDGGEPVRDVPLGENSLLITQDELDKNPDAYSDD